jgi:hypothetical protein
VKSDVSSPLRFAIFGELLAKEVKRFSKPIVFLRIAEARVAILLYNDGRDDSVTVDVAIAESGTSQRARLPFLCDRPWASWKTISTRTSASFSGKFRSGFSWMSN